MYSRFFCNIGFNFYLILFYKIDLFSINCVKKKKNSWVTNVNNYCYIVILYQLWKIILCYNLGALNDLKN